MPAYNLVLEFFLLPQDHLFVYLPTYLFCFIWDFMRVLMLDHYRAGVTFLHMLYEEAEWLYHRGALGIQEIHTFPAVWRTVG